MGLLSDIAKRVLGQDSNNESNDREKKELLRRCYFEVMEQRRVLSADPVIAGVTYLEGDEGQDTTPDHFEVTFEGGAATTQLTQFTINGDQDLSGTLTDGDMFFDYAEGGSGVGGHHGFVFDAENSQGITAADIRGVTFGEDGLSITVEIDNFEAGDVFAFTIDVDEVERFRPDKIASGVEFEGSRFDATFVDENYTFVDKSVSVLANLDGGFEQPQTEGVFYDEYNSLFAEGETVADDQIELTRDNEEGKSDRTAGAIDAYDLVPKPITFAGTVYHDEDLDCEHDSDEDGIEGVEIQLQKLNDGTGLYETIATTSTDANGKYEFGSDLNLQPGTYQIVEIQPEGFLDVGLDAGSEGGVKGNNRISQITVDLGGTDATNYDFKEVRPAALSGNVWHDENNDGVFDANEEGIANVLIQVTRVGAKDGVAEDPFADTTPLLVRTDANGHYEVDMLPPGIYEIVEINNYPPGEVDPLAGFIDGKDATGSVGGVTVGNKTNDVFDRIELCAGDNGVEYNFGEIKPAQISGYVSLGTPEGDCIDPTDPNHVGVGGVAIELYDLDGNLVQATQTDAEGRYEFTGLAPGAYTVVEIQPGNLLDGEESVGTVDGLTAGSLSENDKFSVVLGSGDEGVNYNFCEHLPADISGTVWHDVDDDGVLDDGEERIANVTIELFDKQGNLIAQTVTNADGEYQFDNLYAGEYLVKQTQPGDYLDGQDSLGFVDGNARGEANSNDEFCVKLNAGDSGVRYDFGELRPVELCGTVWHDENNDGVLDSGEERIAGTVIQLFDKSGNLIDEVTTDSDGNYCFTDLAPGEYQIREFQPDGFIDGQDSLGAVNGLVAGEIDQNDSFCVKLESGQSGQNYNFGELKTAEIHGRVWEDGPAFETEDGVLPQNYRDLRDGVYQEGVDRPLEGVRMQLYYYLDPTTDNLIPRPVTLGEVDASFYEHMGTTDPDAPVWVETMANGEYWFQGLMPGNYIVLETQPEGLFDSNDTEGTTTGFSYNSINEANSAPATVITQFSADQIMDSIIGIQVQSGGISQANNFSEVSVTVAPEPPEPPVLPPPTVDPPPTSPPNPTPPGLGVTGFPWLAGSQPSAFTQFVGTSRGASFQTQAQNATPYTWHLSVVNGGRPRAIDEVGGEEQIWSQAGYIADGDWTRFDMEAAKWSFTESLDNQQIVETGNSIRFGMLGGTPLAGDFDGDGIDEVAVFKDGFWMIDINRNGSWDQGDLLARLGDVDDRPVVGDWDGDGKDDIGIFGPIWERDHEAIEREPGLPNPENDPYTKPKNVPPSQDDATNGARVMKLTSFGKQRVDVVDHVFGIHEGDEVPVTGDWNGNGIRAIGTFQDGKWQMDVNGDGRFGFEDVTAEFGQAGDIPLVGDFDGDGIEEIAIYRSGTWIIDSNGNRELDATDKTFEMGSALDKPVVGDWDGDGVDEPGLYTEAQRYIQ